MSDRIQRIAVVDSHTGGEPTRVIVAGGPELGSGSIAGRLELFRTRFDRFRTAVIHEPRGSDVIVGALLLPPNDPICTAGVIFFNNVGYLGMCGHGTIGLLVTLAHMGKIAPGAHRIETPVGVVTTVLHNPNQVSVRNVPSYRHAKDVVVNVDGHGPMVGDVGWGGNWFYLVSNHGQELSIENIPKLTDFAWRVRRALERAGITGADGSEIDHIELFGPPSTSGANARNFVLCPGGAYDRSPCGTGTSAKVACLIEDGTLRPSEIWRQESIIGCMFEASAEVRDALVIPTIRGSAFVTAETTLILDPRDPFCWGIG
jgi:4-hydroxyproline epimerase